MIERIEINKEEIRVFGKGAEIDYIIYLKTGDKIRKHQSLIKEDGIWKLMHFAIVVPAQLPK